MIEMIMLFVLIFLVLLFLQPLLQNYQITKLAETMDIPQDSVLRRHFLTHIRYQNALLADALEKRLAKVG